MRVLVGGVCAVAIISLQSAAEQGPVIEDCQYLLQCFTRDLLVPPVTVIEKFKCLLKRIVDQYDEATAVVVMGADGVYCVVSRGVCRALWVA